MSTTTAPRTTRALPPMMALTDAAANRLRGLYESKERARTPSAHRREDQRLLHGLSYDMSWTAMSRPAPATRSSRTRASPCWSTARLSLFLIGTVMDYEAEKRLLPASLFPIQTKKAAAAAARVFTSDATLIRPLFG